MKIIFKDFFYLWEFFGFLGFVIEGGAAGSGQLTFDELSSNHRNPGALNYTINEFRYSAAASEFVETITRTGSGRLCRLRNTRRAERLNTR